MPRNDYDDSIPMPKFPAKVTKLLAVDRDVVNDTQFCGNSTLVLRERKSGTTFQLSCSQLDSGTLLGRSINTNETQQYLDMTPLGGDDLGVSRLHTYLCYDPEAQAVLAIDLGSMNGTFINEARLGANEVRVLRHGDRLRLGKLEFGVTILYAMADLEIR